MRHLYKKRRPGGRLIFNMGIPIPGKDGLYIETGRCFPHVPILQPEVTPQQVSQPGSWSSCSGSLSLSSSPLIMPTWWPSSPWPGSYYPIGPFVRWSMGTIFCLLVNILPCVTFYRYVNLTWHIDARTPTLRWRTWVLWRLKSPTAWVSAHQLATNYQRRTQQSSVFLALWVM